MPSVISGDANVSATEFGFLDGVTSSLQSQLDAITAVPVGKILQVVRATDATQRTTTSNSFVDASLSVTITPKKSDSAIILIWSSYAAPTNGASRYQTHQITDNSNNALSGAEALNMGDSGGTDKFINSVLIGYSTPATTSATTYKARFNAGPSVTARLQNNQTTGQLYAIEVGA